MLVSSKQEFRIDKLRHKREYGTPISRNNSPLYSPISNNDIKMRPLNTNPKDLSFKGLSFSPYKTVGVFSKAEFLKFSDKYIGKMGRELFEEITQTHSKDSIKQILVEGDKITISKKSIPHLAWDGIIYPFKILPFDLLRGTVELMGHLPGLGKWSEKTLNKDFFIRIQQRSQMDSKINSLKGLITFPSELPTLDAELEKFAKAHNIKISEISEKDRALIEKELAEKFESKLFQRQLKTFDPKVGNYDTKHERALNRLVSGFPPAIFLATDAYNLSRMMDDDPKAADKERKIRFKQETSRILTSGYLTLITMGAFNKFINNSKFGIVLTTGLTVLVTEMYSRLSNGKHITRLTPEEARKENKLTNAPEANIKPVDSKSKQISSTGNPNNKDQQKPLLSFDTLMKASASVIVTGYAIKGLKNLSFIKEQALKYLQKIQQNNPEKFKELGVKNLKLENAVEQLQSNILFGPFNRLYKKLTTENFHVKEEDFNKVISTLKENGFEQLATKYEKVAKAINPDGTSRIINKDGIKYLDLGKHDKKIQPLIKFIVAPFKFVWNTVTLPYWVVDEKIMNLFRKRATKAPAQDIQALALSFDRIFRQAKRIGFKSDKEFKDFMQTNLIKSFNNDNISNVSNAELSNLAKTAATAATIWFLMTDNYNMVMLKSNGNDVNGADTKFKERFVQEGSRLFYQTLLIDLFNSTFRNQYNSSLLGMSWVTLVDTTLGEMLTRSSVGTALKPHSRDELIAFETARNNSTGFKKGYYNFMQRLTGKRSIKSYEVANKNSNNSIIQPTLMKNNINESTLGKIIKG